MNLKDAIRTVMFKKNDRFNQLYTVWGEQLDPNHVLEEYPRPQLVRDNYTILNGYWDYSITKDSSMPNNFDGKILVPFSPESVLSGVNKQVKPDEYLWYQRTISIYDLDKTKRCILHFGAVDQYCEVYINKRKIKEHTGGYLPFSIEITDYIEEGDNLLTLKVIDYSDTSYHSRGKQKLDRGGMFYTAQSGIWQTVWMEWVPKSYIENIKITPLYDISSIKIEVLKNETEESTEHKKIITIKIIEDSWVIKTISGIINSFTISLDHPKSWTPESPYLYGLEITMGEDKVTSYFAMRKFELKKDEKEITRIYLNNQVYFQNGVLDQGYWPDGLYTPPSDEAFIYDIQKAKELGFNMIRKHIKIEPFRWYYHCDRLGMIVWQDMVNGGGKYHPLVVTYLPNLFPRISAGIKDKHYWLFGRRNKKGREEWMKECVDTVDILYNCPCIGVWVPFNEGWGQFDANKIGKLIRDKDPTRLIDEVSGWYDQKGGDFKSVHNYFGILKVIKEERAFALSEFGGYAYYVPKHSYSITIFGYRIYLTREDFNKAFKELYKEDVIPLIVEGLSAAVYTQLTDVEDEVNGLLTYDRKICKIDIYKH